MNADGTGQTRLTNNAATDQESDWQALPAAPPPPSAADRPVTLRLRDHLVARGRVASDFDDCESGVTVKIQRRKGGWKTVKKVETNDTGRYEAELRDRPGRYRALVPAEQLGPNDTCLKAKSPTVRHRH